jgi:serine/threonine protein kinase
VPVAVVAVAVVAGGFLWLRRRKQRQQQTQKERQQQQQLENGTDKDHELPWLDPGIPGLNAKPVGGMNGPDSGLTSGSSVGTGKGGSGTADSKGFGSDLEQLPCDWRMEPEELEILKRPDGSDWQLGTGAFGVVLKAKRAGVQPVAVKVLKSSSAAAGHMGDARFAREIGILRSCRDANILQFVGAFVREGDSPGAESQLCLVTEFMEGGSLQAAIQHNRVSWWRNGKRIALDIARALAYLHSKRLVHLDVKSSNVLLSRDGTAKLGDLGMARLLADQYVTGCVGTLAWSSPEMLLGQKCSQKADVFSFGVCLWEIVTGELPVRGQMRDPQVPEECPQEVDDLINRCIQPNPAERPTARELVQLLEGIPGGHHAGQRRAGQLSPPQLSPTQSWQRAPRPQLEPSGSSELPSLCSSDAKASGQLPSGTLPPLPPGFLSPSSAPGTVPPNSVALDMESPFQRV